MCFQNMFNVSAIRRLRREHNLTGGGGGDDDEAEVSSLLKARGMDTSRLWRETMHTKKGMIKEASSHVHAQLMTSKYAPLFQLFTCGTQVYMWLFSS